MCFTTFATVVLLLAAPVALGQQPSGHTKAMTLREQRRESDSTFIAREWAAWNALKAADSSAFVRAVGSSPSFLYMSDGGLMRTSAARMAGLVTKCDTRSHKLDMFNILRPTDDTAILAYRVTLDRRCGRAVGRGSDVVALQLMSMTVWARRDGRWEAVAQSVSRIVTGNAGK
jgi:Domain of unknown function (DUF4440)